MLCQECSENREIYTQCLCRRCYTKQINGRAMDKILAEFRPQSTYNGELFEMFVGDFKGRHIKNSDLPVARRLAAYLEANTLEKISTWEDIFGLSDKVQIRYTNHATHGCAFMRIGRALEKMGQISSRQKTRTLQFRNLIGKFPAEIKPLINEFYGAIAGPHERTSSTLKILKSVYVFSQNTPSLLSADEQDASNFVKGLARYGSSHFTERIRSIKRFYNWAISKGLCNKNPFFECQLTHIKRECPECGKTQYFWTSDRLCDECYRNSLFKKRHEVLINSFKIRTDYNQHLFSLYLKYVGRYKIRGAHLRSTKLLAQFLESRNLKPIRSWLEVAKTRELFMQFHHLENVPSMGCPIEKIAYVLQELGVLPLREEDHVIYLERALGRADAAMADLLREYLRAIKRQRRSTRSLHGTFNMINDFYLWLKSRGGTGFFAASEALTKEYILSTSTQDNRGVLRGVLGKFYRWAILRRKTLFNPFAHIESVKPQPSLKICSNDTIKSFERFIKKPTSDPESALILCLIFYFGFTACDLAMASVDIAGDDFTITLHRGELSYGHNTHKREQSMRLPSEPAWLHQLQKRYFIFWKARFAKINQDFPSSPLLLRSDSRHGRPIRSLAVRDRVKRATLAAVGFEVPVAVIRRTGAHVYSQQVGASILTRFGWSKDYSYDFVWRQRQLFTPKQK